jgi:Spy/CpxP family protein refolding chaperone
MNRRSLWIAALGLGLMVSPFATAQDRGNRGGFDPARFMEERLNQTKESLGASDDEWQVIKPKIEKVYNAQFASMASRFGGSGRDRSRGSDRGSSDRSNRGPTSPAATAARELRDALDNKDTPADQIVAKLAALREARNKAKAELEAAQKDLQSVLTPRQEAVLVAAGTLD